MQAPEDHVLIFECGIAPNPEWHGDFTDTQHLLAGLDFKRRK
jgi:hypothetical protein